MASCFSGASDVVVCQSVKDGRLTEVPELHPDVEEADARIIPHAIHAVKGGMKRIIVLSGDTDVFIRLMHYWNFLHSIGLCELWLRAVFGIQQDISLFIQ